MNTRTPKKHALVTGASSGIGLEYAYLLANEGYALVLAGDRETELLETARRIAEDTGAEVLPVCTDLSEPNAAERLFAWTSARKIEIETLICNAGILLQGALTGEPPERLERIVALHCTTPTLLCRLYGGQMRRRGRGAILLMSSATAWMPYPTIAAYAATKSYLRSFARSLHDELADDGVAVTAVFPGAVDTPLYRLDARRRRLLVRLGIMSTAHDVARKGLRALGRNRRRCIPGLFTKICVAVCRMLPACTMRLIVRIPAVRRLF